jgi:hypothetical protein
VRRKETEMQERKIPLLKGNFPPRNEIVKEDLKEDLSAQFEREALKRLGGSIAFVAKKKFLYGMRKETEKK